MVLDEKIRQVLDQNIRPYISSHGGEIEVLGLEGGVLKIRLLGACSTCPAAYITTEQFIREEMVEAVPDIEDVVLVQSVSEDLIAQAKSILSGH